MVARRDVEIGIDKFNRLIDALGCEDAASKRIEKTLRDLKADRLRNERRIDGLGRLPDGALGKRAPIRLSTRLVRSASTCE